MSIEELRVKLNELKVPKHYYSINGSCLPNTYVLLWVYRYWECFYVDERGGQNAYRKFDSEECACKYFLEMLMNEMKYSS